MGERTTAPSTVGGAATHPEPSGPDSTAAEVLQASVAAAARRILEHVPVIRAGTDPEGVHQARVGARRMRADLRTFAPFLEPAWADRLRTELRWLGGALGEHRDLDVLLARLRQETADVPAGDAAAVEALLDRLAGDRARARSRALAALDGRRFARLEESLTAVTGGAVPATPAAVAPAAAELPKQAGAAFGDLRRTAAERSRRPSDDALHRLRIKAKRARYAADVAVPVVGDPAAAYVKALGQLQKVLGAQHDHVAAADRLRAMVPSASREQAYAIGLLVAGEVREADRLRPRWRAAWKAVDRPKRTRWMDG